MKNEKSPISKEWQAGQLRRRVTPEVTPPPPPTRIKLPPRSKNIEFCYDFNDEKEYPSQVYIAIGTSNTNSVISELEEIIRTMKNYGKPRQGIILSSNTITEIITPIWDGKEY